MTNNHQPGHIRASFAALVAEDWNEYDDEIAPRELLGLLSDCLDVMPRDLCELLALPQTSYYAMGVGAYVATRGEPERV